MSANNPTESANAEDERIANALRSHLDESVQTYDAATLSRLNQARQSALDELPKARAQRWYWPGLGLAAAAALVLMLSVQRESISPAPATLDQSMVNVQLSDDEIALLASDDDLDLFQDLEFYAWLEQQQDWDGSSS